MKTACLGSVLVSVCLLVLGTSVAAQGVLYNTLSEAGDNALRAGKYADAERIYKQLRDTALQAKGNAIYLSRANSKLAEAYRMLGRPAEAEKLIKETLTLTEQQLGPDHFDIPFLLEALGNVTLAQGRFAEADQILKTSQQIAAKNPTRNADVLYNVQLSRIKLHLTWGKFSEAKALIDSLQAQLRAANKASSFEYAYTVFLDGNLAEQLGRFNDATVFYEKALEGAAAAVGKKHPVYGSFLVSSANAYRAESKYDKAEAVLKEGLAIAEASYTEDHTEKATPNMMLALVYGDLGKYAKAEELARKALEMYERALGPEAPELTNAKGVLGRINRYQGKYKDAERLTKEGIELSRKLVGSQNVFLSNSLDDLGQIYGDQGKYAEAESALKEARSLVLNNLGPDHVNIAEINQSLGHLYLTQNRLSEAEPLLKQSLEGSTRVMGKETSSVSSKYLDLAELFLRQKKLLESEKHAREALGIDEKLFGPDSARVAADLDLLVRVLNAQNKTGEANQFARRFAAIQKQLPGSAMLSTLNNSGVNAALASPDKRPVADKWALVVGISNFKDPSINLKYAAKDATDFKEFLIKHEHFKADHVMLLTDEQATREQIVAKLGDAWLGKVAKPDDLVVVYVSSHGSSSRDEVGVNFLVAHDTTQNSLLATGIPLQWLNKIIKEQVHSDRTILILDVCHSAAAATGSPDSAGSRQTGSSPISGGADGKNLVYKPADKVALKSRPLGINTESLNLGSGQILLCSSLADQVSWESKNYANSVFTKRLMEALRVKGDQTSLKDAYQSLKTSVQSEVLRDRGELQIPLLSAKEWTGGDPILSAPPASPRSPE